MNYKERALRICLIREHSKKELREKLRQKGANAEEIESIVQEMLQIDALNEERFIRQYARKLGRKLFSKSYIQLKLREKGLEVSIESIEEHIEDLNYKESIKEKIIYKLQKKSKEQVIRYFINKGHKFNEINGIILSLK